ncbi:MAG: fructosamine kinase family protein [Polyangiales bacterium]
MKRDGAGALASKLAARLGSPVVHSRAASGGDINTASRVELADGRVLFVKSQTAALPGLFPSEASGLAWLREASALRIPEVHLASDADELGPACLVLEHIQVGRRGPQHDEQLGAGLAALHRAGADHFGLGYDNYLATLTQNNRAAERWAEFYGERRIRPLTERAARQGHLDARLTRRVETLIARLPELVGPDEPPARLHGDLWSGNALCDEHGAPVLIDPAVYGGHREIDLAMMRLFGGFSERVFAAYAAAYPLAPGHTERVALYQLYPLLAHVNLFGSSYVSGVERCVAAWV